MNNDRLSNEQLLVEESLFSVANGYIGIRGNFEEGYPFDYSTIRGSYINGVYEIVDLTYAENAFGFPNTAQKMVNLMDAQGIIVYFEEERFSLFEGTVLEYSRKLDTQLGFALRNVRWKSPKGHVIDLTFKKMASFCQLELMMIDIEITSVNFDGMIRIESTLQGNVENYTGKGAAVHDPRVSAGHAKLVELETSQLCEVEIEDQSSKESNWTCGVQVLRAKRADIVIAATMSHTLPMTYECVDSMIIASYSGILSNKQTLRMTKVVSFSDSRRQDNPKTASKEIIGKVLNQGIEYYFEAQKKYLEDFWKTSSITIDSEDGANEAVHYNSYQLLASTGKDGISNVSAKGLSGEGYEGHYFWDTEIYILPFFILTQPKLARHLLKYRYSIIDKARERAIQLGHSKGAKIPWRTINGDECSGYFPAGCAQYHINADVAYSYIQYYFMTKDDQFMLDYGFEMLFETARVWLEMGHFLGNEFRIDTVTGPDEYSAIVNNNYYTNSMAKYHLHYVGFFYSLYLDTHPALFLPIIERLQITKSEVDEMNRASELMYLPYDDTLNICLQDDSFAQKAEWDFENTPREKHPLLLYFHPLTIYRHKVLKQADTVLAHFLLDNVEEQIVKNSYHYYEKRTTHDSSLSPCVHGIMASKIGEPDQAYDFFMNTLRLDLDNLHHNTKDGLHIANLGGVYMSVVYGFGGLRIKEGSVSIAPTLPKKWNAYTFRLSVQGKLTQVKVTEETVEIEAEQEVLLKIYNKDYIITSHIVIKR